MFTKTFKTYSWSEKKIGKAIVRFFNENVIVTERQLPIDNVKYISFASFLASSVRNSVLFTVEGKREDVVKALKKIIHDDLSSVSSGDVVIIADGHETSVEAILRNLFARYVVIIINLGEEWFVAGVKRK